MTTLGSQHATLESKATKQQTLPDPLPHVLPTGDSTHPESFAVDVAVGNERRVEDCAVHRSPWDFRQTLDPGQP